MASFRRALIRIAVGLLVLALVGAVGFLLSQLNSRTFTLEQRDGQLVILKGRELPTGAEPYHPQDATLVEAYAPIPLEGTEVDAGLWAQKFTDRDELDRALFDVLAKLAAPRVQADDAQAIDRGFYFLKRAEGLSGIRPDQRAALQKLRSDGAFYQGRLKLDEARKSLHEALTQLHVAADSQNKHSRSANQMLIAVEPPGRALEEALRAAVNSLSAPSQAPELAPPPLKSAEAADAGTSAAVPDASVPSSPQ